MALDTGSLQPLKDAANSASNSVADMTGSAPSLLNALKTNLTTIFVKDNPFLTERNTALTNFLNAPSQSRVATLPQNLPTVEGSQLNLSPTQQDAVTTSARNAAMVPLVGLNQIVTGLYGNIPGMVQNAGQLYDASIKSASMKAEQANRNYTNAFQELIKQEDARQYESDLAEKVREFNISQANKSGTGNDFNSLSDYLQALQSQQQSQQTPQSGYYAEGLDLSSGTPAGLTMDGGGGGGGNSTPNKPKPIDPNLMSKSGGLSMGGSNSNSATLNKSYTDPTDQWWNAIIGGGKNILRGIANAGG